MYNVQMKETLCRPLYIIDTTNSTFQSFKASSIL